MASSASRWCCDRPGLAGRAEQGSAAERRLATEWTLILARRRMRCVCSASSAARCLRSAGWTELVAPKAAPAAWTRGASCASRLRCPNVLSLDQRLCWALDCATLPSLELGVGRLLSAPDVSAVQSANARGQAALPQPQHSTPCSRSAAARNSAPGRAAKTQANGAKLCTIDLPMAHRDRARSCDGPQNGNARVPQWSSRAISNARRAASVLGQLDLVRA